MTEDSDIVFNMEENTPEQIKGMINPATDWIDWARLPAEERHYKFGPEVLPFLRSSTKLVLLIEDQMARGGAGHARRSNPEVLAELEKAVGKYLSPEGIADREYVASSNDDELVAWAARAEKFAAKQVIKDNSWGINLTNLPFRAGPEEIKGFVERTLEKKGCVLAMDPWWAKKGWIHDGGVTVYLSEKDAQHLLDAGAEELVFSPELRRRVKITPGSDGKITRVLCPQAADPWD
jgi:hypothetical protein